MKKKAFTSWYSCPSFFQQNFWELSLHHKHANGCPYKLLSNGTTGFVILSCDVGLRDRGRRKQITRHYPFRNLNYFGASSIFAWAYDETASLASPAQSGSRESTPSTGSSHVRCRGTYYMGSWIVHHRITTWDDAPFVLVEFLVQFGIYEPAWVMGTCQLGTEFERWQSEEQTRSNRENKAKLFCSFFKAHGHVHCHLRFWNSHCLRKRYLQLNHFVNTKKIRSSSTCLLPAYVLRVGVSSRL